MNHANSINYKLRSMKEKKKHLHLPKETTTKRTKTHIGTDIKKMLRKRG